MLALCSNALAAITNVEDLNLTDMNTIENQYFDSMAYVVNESYGEDATVPYSSHDGNAIVNDLGEFFEKEVTVDAAGNYTLIFNVTNNTPHTWSDYHFIIDSDVTLTNFGNDVFANSNYDGTELAFWAPEWVEPGETAQFNLEFSVAEGINSFELTQIATTTVPIPGAVWLLASGLGFVSLRRKLNK
jgi:hypothetical protein